jgi:glycosyltransferase involved in cell wall biosynthesis
MPDQSMPKVSVIIPCYNHGEFLPDAVASVTSLHRDDVELIVVDDGSTDDRTRREMDAIAAQGIHVIRQQNQGLAAARNAGIAVAHGEYILPLDADNRIRAAYIEHGIRILDEDPKAGVVYGDVERIPYNGTKDPLRPAGHWDVGAFSKPKLLLRNYIDACAVYRRVIWEQNGGYDGSMPVQGLEDWDFWLGALEQGWKFLYVPEVLYDYRVIEGSMITRAWGHRPEVEAYVAKKHSTLYREAWLELANEVESGKATLRNLRRIVKTRLKERFHLNGNHR